MGQPHEIDPDDEINWDAVIDPSTGWLLPGVHEVEVDELAAEFVTSRHDDRRSHTWSAYLALLHQTKALYPSGRMFLCGTFVSRKAGPVEALSVAIVPDEPSTIELWTEAEWDRFYQHISLYDVILGSLGPTYMPVIHPFGGRLEVMFVHPDDAEDVASWMGASLHVDGREIPGAMGVAEVVW